MWNLTPRKAHRFAGTDLAQFASRRRFKGGHIAAAAPNAAGIVGAQRPAYAPNAAGIAGAQSSGTPGFSPKGPGMPPSSPSYGGTVGQPNRAVTAPAPAASPLAPATSPLAPTAPSPFNPQQPSPQQQLARSLTGDTGNQAAAGGRCTCP